MMPSIPVQVDRCWPVKKVMKRCVHCERRYLYEPGLWHDKTMDARYCPACKEVILHALSSVPKSVFMELLPVPPGHEVTIEVFKEKYAEWEASVMLKSYPFRVGTPVNFEYKYLKIGDVEYVLIRNKDTGEELLHTQYEVSVATQQIEDLWHEL